jgi:ADP-heptose:LPS heptosyltransferase
MYRSIPFEKMMGAMPDDVEVYYIDTEQEFPGVINLKDRINNWEDTLDYVSQMDIVVSSCTSLPHIAGAMGIPTAVMVPIAEYYIWSSSRQNDTSPWYGDSFRVFKQKKVRNWDEPLEKANKYILKIMKENGYAD